MSVERIGGDIADLPKGWSVDADNWGTRLVRNGDLDRMRGWQASWFLDDGIVYVMDAATARQMDGLNPPEGN